ncbi:MAG: hypothetical protein ACE5GO_00540 [Anaerolineales bacterium]
MTTPPYIPGHPPDATTPLARYLPPIPAGAAGAWLRECLPPGSWVLDPFGASPSLAIEIARAGYRVLVAANNPIVRFLLEMQATPPRRDELQAVLAALSVARKGDERLEPHILSLYTTTCAHCEAQVSADAFLWERDAGAPFARIYRCPHCAGGDSAITGEHPATGADAANAARFAALGLHRARALERVLPLLDPDREHVEEALKVYPPRAVYALFTLINKLDGLPLSPYRKHLLAALLLAAFDQTNTLWPHPIARARPKQLTVPPRYRENNVWRALESAVDVWDWPEARATPLVHWPGQLPERGGISLFRGRLKELAKSLSEVEIGAVLTAIPRPNQAFWTLSALWSGWLWGPEAAGPFRSVLRRRRYDWAWHTTALHAALHQLSKRLAPGAPFFGLLAEADPGPLTAILIAANMTRFELQGIAIRDRASQAQITWRAGGAAGAAAVDDETRAAISQQAARAHLQQRGQPGPFLPMQAAALTRLASRRALTLPRQEPGAAYTAVRDLFEHTLPHHSGLVRYDGSPHALDVGQWGLQDTGEAGPPLADRVETALIAHLSAHPGSALAEVDAAICAAFPGLLTPEHDLVCTCLESYGEPDGAGRYSLRAQDQPEQRAADLDEMGAILIELGERLGYRVPPGPVLVWQSLAGEVAARFFIQTSAALGEIVYRYQPAPERSFIVIPGGREP